MKLFSAAFIISLFLAVPALLSAELDSALVGYWCFDDMTSQIVPDHSGNNYHGRIIGGIAPANGVYGSAARFGGSMSQYIIIDNFPSISRNLTISAWFRPDSMPFKGKQMNPLVTKGNSSNHEEYTLWVDYSRFMLLLNLERDRIDCLQNMPHNVNDNGFCFVAAVYDYDHNEIRLFQNAELAGICNYQKDIHTNSEPLILGASFPGGQEYFRGDLDEVRVYNRALSIEEIKELYTTFCNNVNQPLHAAFRLDTLSALAGDTVTFDVMARISEDIKITTGVTFDVSFPADAFYPLWSQECKYSVGQVAGGTRRIRFATDSIELGKDYAAIGSFSGIALLGEGKFNRFDILDPVFTLPAIVHEAFPGALITSMCARDISAVQLDQAFVNVASSSAVLTLKGANAIREYTALVYTVDGSLAAAFDFTGSIKYSLHGLSSGFYFVQISSGAYRQLSKFVKFN